MRKLVCDLPLEQRLQVPGLDARRADLVVAGAAAARRAAARRSTPRTSRCAIWRCARAWCSTSSSATASTSARSTRSPTSAADRRSSWPSAAAGKPTTRSRWRGWRWRIFDGLRSLHGLGDREREWLEYASWLHDVGNHISYERHHRHSYYLIKHGDLRGFEPAEIEIIALVARYHRRAEPSRGHEGYGDLPGTLRRSVRVLGAILRLAESLDRSRTGAIRGLAVNTRADTVQIELEGRGDAELEVWAANRSLIPLERALKRPVRLQVRIVEDPEATPAARAEAAPTPVDAPVRRRAKRAPARRKRRARKAPAAPSRDQPAWRRRRRRS